MSYAPTQKPITMRTTSSSDLSSLHTPVLQRHRKTVSTGGGRAWSEAEEAYLIETRERKMPYKHIAAQLKKTELACRLHYHQLSFGAKSRRSATPNHPSIHHSHSVSGRSSLTPPPAGSYRQSPPQRHLPSFSPPASPPETIYPPTSTSAATDMSHKPILPKPVSSPFCRANTSSPHNLRLVTEDINRTCYVDITRLDRLYDAHRLHFWSTIASEYGGNLSPATLEDAWRRAHSVSTGSNFPPTPRGSPQSAAIAEPRPAILATPFSALSADPLAAQHRQHSQHQHQQHQHHQQQHHQQQQQSGSASATTPSGTSKFSALNRPTETVAMIPRSSYPSDLSSGGSESSVTAAARRNTASSATAGGSGMSVSAMLTENKEVRSPGREKTVEEVEGAMDVDVDDATGGYERAQSSSRADSVRRSRGDEESPATTSGTPGPGHREEQRVGSPMDG